MRLTIRLYSNILFNYLQELINCGNKILYSLIFASTYKIFLLLKISQTTVCYNHHSYYSMERQCIHHVFCC